MQRREFALSGLSLAVLGLSGCGGGGGSAVESGAPNPAVTTPNPAPVLELASTTTLPKGTQFMQTRAAQGGRELAPGQANVWDLENGFSLQDGGDDQWDTAFNLSVAVGTNPSTSWDDPAFGGRQASSELSAYGPELGVADGLKIVSFEPGRAFLHPIKGSRLEQAINLGGATAPITLRWTQLNINWAQAAFFFGTSEFPDEPFSFSVAFRPDSGGAPVTLFQYALTGMTGTPGQADLSALAGQAGTLSFEYVAASKYPVVISSVSILDDDGHEFVANGQFATTEQWSVPDVKVSQNIQSGVREVNGVQIQRMFFTQPNALWGRFTDTFRNVTTGSLDVAVRYSIDLGSDDRGIIYNTPDANGRAITSWDTTSNLWDHDVAVVFGSPATVAYTSADFAGSGGRDTVDITFSLTISPGETVTLVVFALMSGLSTGVSATSAGARATELDTVAADIANNFRSNVAYQRGMLSSQLSTLRNF